MTTKLSDSWRVGATQVESPKRETALDPGRMAGLAAVRAEMISANIKEAA